MKDSPKIKILVACHKTDPNIRQDEIYMPVQVGKALHPDLDLGFQPDNEGENISDKNGTYCELTAIYWAWKNLKDADYIGLAHYRRYFSFDGGEFRDIITVPSGSEKIPSGDSGKIRQALEKADIIVANGATFPYRAAYDYAIGHHGDDFKTLFEIIKEKFPEYTEAFERVFLRGNRLSLYNMFITRRDIFDEYCEFLFGVLGEAETRINTRDYTPYQKRLLGFLAERLLNVFVAKKKMDGLRIMTRPVIWITNDFAPTSRLKYLANRIRYNLAFRLQYVRNPRL